nr:spermatid nuclear transition protein 4-like [Dasypus novemcinctus]
MTKVPRKSRDPRTIAEQSTARTKQRMKTKTAYQARARDGGKMQNTTLKLKRPHQGTLKKKVQTPSTGSKKPKKAKRSIIYVCCHSLSKKWSRSKRQKQKRGKPSKRLGQTKRRGQLEKKQSPWSSPCLYGMPCSCA